MPFINNIDRTLVLLCRLYIVIMLLCKINCYYCFYLKVAFVPNIVSLQYCVMHRERTIIGSVSYRCRYWVYRIESYRLLLYRPIYAHQCRFINCWQDRITHDDQRAFKRPVTRPPRVHACELFYGPRYGRGLEGREAEGDCNLIQASPWHKGPRSTGFGHHHAALPHRQEVITTVSCQSL